MVRYDFRAWDCVLIVIGDALRDEEIWLADLISQNVRFAVVKSKCDRDLEQIERDNPTKTPEQIKHEFYITSELLALTDQKPFTLRHTVGQTETGYTVLSNYTNIPKLNSKVSSPLLTDFLCFRSPAAGGRLGTANRSQSQLLPCKRHMLRGFRIQLSYGRR